MVEKDGLWDILSLLLELSLRLWSSSRVQTRLLASPRTTWQGQYMLAKRESSYNVYGKVLTQVEPSSLGPTML